MSEQNATITPPAEEAFDFAKWKAAEDAKATGAEAKAPAQAETPKPGQPAAPKTAAAPVDPAIPAAPADSDEEGDDYAGLPKGVKRQLRQARRERDQYKGRVDAYEAMIAAGYTPKQAAAAAATEVEGIVPAQAAAAAEPQRSQFNTDLEYLTALNKYETKRLFDEHNASTAAAQAEHAEAAQFDTTINTANAKFVEDVKAYENWNEIAESMKAIPFQAKEQATLVGLIGTSLHRVAVFVHWSKHPEELKALMETPADQQAAKFYRLEGRLEAQGPPTPKAATPAPAAPAAPAATKSTKESRDSRIAAPSETVKATGGQGADGLPSMMLADGTINPVWLARENEKDGLRR